MIKLISYPSATYSTTLNTWKINFFILYYLFGWIDTLLFIQNWWECYISYNIWYLYKNLYFSYLYIFQYFCFSYFQKNIFQSCCFCIFMFQLLRRLEGERGRNNFIKSVKSFAAWKILDFTLVDKREPWSCWRFCFLKLLTIGESFIFRRGLAYKSHFYWILTPNLDI